MEHQHITLFCSALFGRYLSVTMDRSGRAKRMATKISRFESDGLFPLGLSEVHGVCKQTENIGAAEREHHSAISTGDWTHSRESSKEQFAAIFTVQAKLRAAFWIFALNRDSDNLEKAIPALFRAIIFWLDHQHCVAISSFILTRYFGIWVEPFSNLFW